MSLLLLASVLVAIAVLTFAYRSTPMLSQDWRIVASGNPDRWRHGKNTVVVWLVRRFRFAQLQYTTLSNQNRILVGEVEVGDPEFDERLIEIRMNAEDIRRRLRAIA